MGELYFQLNGLHLHVLGDHEGIKLLTKIIEEHIVRELETNPRRGAVLSFEIPEESPEELEYPQ